MALVFLAALAMAIPANASIVVINELMYHPNDIQGDVEFIELYNGSAVERDLGGWYFSDGIDYTFPPETWIPADGYVVVASSPTVFASVYPGVSVLGPYNLSLSNAGERVVLRNAAGGEMDMVEYNDRGQWPVAADGTGHTLSLRDPVLDNRESESWAPSLTIGGTPGEANFPTPPVAPTVVINELQCNSAGGTWLELRNLTGSPLDVSGLHLSNNRNALNARQIPTISAIPAGGYRIFDQATLGFALTPTGGRLYLTDSSLTRVIDAVDYEGTEPGHSRGRYFDARNHVERWYYMTTPTPGNANVATIRDEIVINEIMYHTLVEDENREYVEIYNRGTQPVDLTGWRFTDGIGYDFTTGTLLGAGQYLVVAANAPTLISIYGLSTDKVVGNYVRRLNDDRDRLVLVDNYGNVADEVRYFDGGRWSDWADGGGSSLELIDFDQSNDYPSAWAPSNDSAKAQWTHIEYTKPQIEGIIASNPSYYESELHLMLIDDGICLVDDVEITAAGQTTNRIANGGFESGQGSWKLGGTHKHSQVTPAAAHSGSRGLRLVADGRGREGINHVETDAISGLEFVEGADYRISCWAKWIVGCPQLLTRTHYHGVAQTTPLPVPDNLGTPGAPNSRYQSNIGPIVANVAHSPVTPKAWENVTVRALALDSDGVAAMTLYYKEDTAGAYSNVTMFDDGSHGDGAAGDDVYGGVIPSSAHNDRDLMEFYIVARDTTGRTLTFPASETGASPPERRALYRVRNATRNTALKTFELLVNDDVQQTVSSFEKMDNELMDATFTLNDEFVFYNVGFRYKGSGYTRPTGWAGRPSYRIHFNSDQPLFGLISVNVDNQRGGGDCGRNDRMVQWLMYKLGVPVPSHEYVRFYRHSSADRFAEISTSGYVYDHVKRIDKEFLDWYYPDGNDGHLHKVDDHMEWSDSMQMRRRSPDDTSRLKFYGEDEELYRWILKPRTHEYADDFTSLVTMIKFMDPDVTGDAEWAAGVEDLIETDEWLKKLAASAVCDDWDTLGMEHGGDPRGKNCYIYARSDSGRWVLIPWDDDLTFNTATRAIRPTWWFDSCERLMSYGKYGRQYLHYIQQLVDGPFSTLQWNEQLDRLEGVLIAENDFSCSLSAREKPRTFQQNRLPWLINNALPGPVTFEITTNGGDPFGVDTPTVDLVGKGGLDIETFRVNGTPVTDVTWLDDETWMVRNIPLTPGSNGLTVTGHDAGGSGVGSDSIEVIRYTSLRALPYGTSFERTGAPPFYLGSLPRNYWIGRGEIQNSTVYEGQQAVGLNNGWTEHAFLGNGHSTVWVDTYIRTEGATEEPSTPEDATDFAAQLYFSASQGILALDGDGTGGGSWTPTGVSLSGTEFQRIAIRLDYPTQTYDVYVDGQRVLSGMGFAYPKTEFSWFRYYSSVAGAMDKFYASPRSADETAVRPGRWSLFE